MIRLIIITLLTQKSPSTLQRAVVLTVLHLTDDHRINVPDLCFSFWGRSSWENHQRPKNVTMLRHPEKQLDLNQKLINYSLAQCQLSTSFQRNYKMLKTQTINTNKCWFRLVFILNLQINSTINGYTQFTLLWCSHADNSSALSQTSLGFIHILCNVAQIMWSKSWDMWEYLQVELVSVWKLNIHLMSVALV